MNDPISLLRSVGKALPVLVLLHLLHRPLTAAQVAGHLRITEKTARSYLKHLLRITDPPLAAAIGHGQFISLPSAQLLLPVSVDKPVDNLGIETVNFTVGREILPSLKYLSKIDRQKESDSDSLTDSLSKTVKITVDEAQTVIFTVNLELSQMLLVRGVYQSVANHLVSKNSPEQITAAVAYYDQLNEKGKARGPGFLVQLLRGNWRLPESEREVDGCGYATGKYANFVEH